MKSLHTAPGQHKIAPAQVLYLTGDVNYSTLFLLDGQEIQSSRTLKWYAEKWPPFVRIHKANLVNPEHIYGCIRISSIVAHLMMNNGAKLQIGRRRISQVVKQLGLGLPIKGSTSTRVINPEWRSFVPAELPWAA